MKKCLHYDIERSTLKIRRVTICKGKIVLSVLMAGVMCLHFSMQDEDILEHNNGKCHLCTHLSNM